MCTKRFRFSLTAAGQQTISASDILAFLSLRVTDPAGSDYFPLIDKFRIELVELYGPMSGSLAPVTVAFEWVASASGFSVPSKKRSDTSMSSSCCAYTSYRPDRDSLSNEWMNTSTGSLFTVNGPASTVMDIVVLFALNDGSIITTANYQGYIGTRPPTGFTPLGWTSN